MIVSIDDFRLLLKKWQNESISVSVMSVVKASGDVLAVVHVQGRITRLKETQFLVTDENRHSIATVNFGKCTFTYGRTEDLFGAEGAKYDEDCIIVALDNDGEHAFVCFEPETDYLTPTYISATSQRLDSLPVSGDFVVSYKECSA